MYLLSYLFTSIYLFITQRCILKMTDTVCILESSDVVCGMGFQD